MLCRGTDLFSTSFATQKAIENSVFVADHVFYYVLSLVEARQDFFSSMLSGSMAHGGAENYGGAASLYHHKGPILPPGGSC